MPVKDSAAAVVARFLKSNGYDEVCIVPSLRLPHTDSRAKENST
jgi:hypothetical protein